MRSFYAIYRKEMGHYFVSPIAYVFIGLFLALNAFVFTIILNGAIQRSFEIEMQSMRYGMPPEIDVPSEVMRSFLSWLPFFILFLTPILSMGLYSEERKRGTIELLMTSPITESQIVLGKFFSVLTLFAIAVLPTASYLVFMYFRSEPRPPWGMLLAGYAGVLLFGGALLALGTFISSLTENQIIAAVLAFVASFMIWILDAGSRASGAVGEVLSYLSVIHHYEDFTRGVVDTSSVIYYVSFIFLFVFLTIRSVDSMRWRRA
jgi:ABC-2 type transport system permease protein